jgi:ATP-binding cassette subfamily B protein RaxB
LDEGTSHLDLENERAVNAALSQLAITRLVVAHRPETLRAAGRVVSLQEGVLVAADMYDKSTQAKHHESA